MRHGVDPGAELGGVVEVRERLPLRDGHPEEREERAPALADLIDQEAVRGHVPAHLLVVPVKDVDGEGPVLEPAPEQPVPEPVEHPLEDEHPGTEQEGPTSGTCRWARRMVWRTLSYQHSGSRTVRMTFASG